MSIKTAREAKGLTVQQLADLVPCDASSIHRYESGTSTPSQTIAARIESILDIDVEEAALSPEQRLRRLAPDLLTLLIEARSLVPHHPKGKSWHTRTRKLLERIAG